MRLLDGTTFIYTFFYVFDEDCWLPGSYLQKNKEVIVFPSLYFLLLLFVLLFFATTDEYKEYISRLFAAYLHIRVWRYSLEGASRLEVPNIMLYIRSPSKKREDLRLTRIIVSCLRVCRESATSCETPDLFKLSRTIQP